MTTEILTIIHLTIGIITGGFTILTLVSEKFRAFLFNGKKAKEARAQYEKERKETDKCLLRDSITAIYYRHKEEKTLHQYQFEDLALLYKQYKQLGGNSFIDKIWGEMQAWTVIE